jgi:hypothetical protein
MLGWQLADSVFRIQCDNGKSEGGTGTGFYVQFHILNGQTLIFGVSASHVFDGAKSFSFRMNRVVGVDDDKWPDFSDSRNVEFGVEDLIRSPSSADVVLFPVGRKINAMHQAGFYPMIRTWDYRTGGLLPESDENGIEPGRDVLVPMFPNRSLVLSTGEPIVRKGSVASRVQTDVGRGFILDIETHSGASGAPVILVKHIHYLSLDGQIQSRVATALIGIITHALQDKHEIELGLGVCLPAQSIIDFIPVLEKSYQCTVELPSC